MTHLHTDHVGWNTVQQDGKWVPTFPKAQLSLPQEPSSTTGRREYDKGDKTVQAGLVRRQRAADLRGRPRGVHRRAPRKSPAASTPEPVPGHAPGMLSFRMRSRGEEGLFTADIMHNAIQIVRPDWNDRYCLWPDKALESRAAALKRAAERGALIMPMHLGAPYCGYVRRQGDGYAFEPAT